MWPALSMIVSVASGQARSSSQAVIRGPARSKRPWIRAPGMPVRRWARARSRPFLQPGSVGEVVGADPDERQLLAVRAAAVRGRAPGRFHRDDRVLPGAPVRRRLLPYGRVLALQPAGVRRDQTGRVARLGDARAEGGPGLGEELSHAPVEPVDLAAAGRRHRLDHHLRDPLRVLLGVRQDQGRAPRAPVQQPRVDVQVLPQAFHVGDQVGRRVVPHVRRRIARVRCGAAAAPLVEEDHPVAVRVEVPAGAGRAAGPGAAVDHEGRLAVRVAAHLPVHVVAVPDIQHPALVRLDRRIPRVIPCPVHSYALPGESAGQPTAAA
ncbi:hypothetical protein SBADM41S_08610 [Streptomyces badius]